MKTSIILIVSTLVAPTAFAAITYQVGAEQANRHGVYSFSIDETPKTDNTLGTFTLRSSSGVNFTVTETSTSGAKQLKAALKRPEALRKENQTILFNVGKYIAKAQALDAKIQSSFDDFQVEADRQKRDLERGNAQVDRDIHARLSTLNHLDGVAGIDGYEELLRLHSTGQLAAIQQLFTSQNNLQASIERSISKLNQFATNLANEQKEFIDFSKSAEANETVSQSLKIRSATFYLRNVATTIHHYIGLIQGKANETAGIKDQVIALNSEALNYLNSMKDSVYSIRSKLLQANPDSYTAILAVDTKYNAYYSSNGRWIALANPRNLNTDLFLGSNNNQTYLCESRICSFTMLTRLEEQIEFSFLVHKGNYYLFKGNETLVINEQELADIAKMRECSGDMARLKVASDYFLQLGQIMGWFVVGGAGESAVNGVRYMKDEETNYNYTQSKMRANNTELMAADKKWRRLQDIYAQAGSQFAIEFRPGIIELAERNVHLVSQSNFSCEE
jgi:hypothetical protein